VPHKVDNGGDGVKNHLPPHKIKKHRKLGDVDTMDNKGQTNSGVVSFLIFAVMVIVAVIVFSNFESAAGDTALTTAGTASKNNITANTYSAYQLVAIGPIIMGAVVILGIIAVMGKR